MFKVDRYCITFLEPLACEIGTFFLDKVIKISLKEGYKCPYTRSIPKKENLATKYGSLQKTLNLLCLRESRGCTNIIREKKATPQMYKILYSIKNSPISLSNSPHECKWSDIPSPMSSSPTSESPALQLNITCLTVPGITHCIYIYISLKFHFKDNLSLSC